MNLPDCPRCHLYLSARGCTPERCANPEGAAELERLRAEGRPYSVPEFVRVTMNRPVPTPGADAAVAGVKAWRAAMDAAPETAESRALGEAIAAGNAVWTGPANADPECPNCGEDCHAICFNEWPSDLNAMAREETIEAMRRSWLNNGLDTVGNSMALVFDDVIAPMLADAQVHGHGMGQEAATRSDLDTFRAMLERAGIVAREFHGTEKPRSTWFAINGVTVYFKPDGSLGALDNEV